MRYWPVHIVVFLLVAACQMTPTRTPAARSELIDGIIKVATIACAKVQPGHKEFLETLNTTPQEVCECAYTKFFGAMSEAETDRFIDDGIKIGGQIAQQEPWKTQILAATVTCMAKKAPGLAMSVPNANSARPVP